MRRFPPGLAALVAVAVVAGIAIVLQMDALAADERYYGPQVRRFLEGRFELEPGITMLPGYHAVLAALLAPLGDYSEQRARVASLAVGLALLPLCWALARRNYPDAAAVKSAQAFLQPLFFPYAFLIYTEAWSLAALAAMVLATLHRRHGLAASVGLAGTLMRQDFIFWVGFACVLTWLEDVDATAWRAHSAKIARDALARGLPYLAVMAAFVAFVAWNGGVAMADRDVHTTPFNLANVWFFYACAWLVFLPHNLEAIPRIAALLKRPAVAIAVVAGFAVYWATWSNPHPYNQAHLRFWLHNEVLYWIDHAPAFRALLYVPIAWSALTLLSTRMPEPRMAALHVFAPLAALLHPLVEQRYYLPAMMLYVLWRPPVDARWERATLFAYVPAGLLLLGGIATAAFFP